MSKKIVLIIQARMGSKRLPGKSIMNLAGKPLLHRILERITRVQKIDEIVLAIPSTKENKILENIGLENGIKVFSGSEDDVLDRFYKASLKYGAEVVGRFPADNVAPEPNEIDRIILSHLDQNQLSFSTNLCQVRENGYPDGIGAEMFDFALLKHVWVNNNDHAQREHVHLNFFDYKTDKGVDENWCPINTIQCPIEFRRPDLILDVNTNEQFLFMEELYNYLYPKKQEFNIIDIIKWYDEIYNK